MTISPDTDLDRRTAAAAARLQRAIDDGAPCAPVRDVIGTVDQGLAYSVQQCGIRTRLAAGAHIVGRKIGLTSPAVQQQLKVDRPDFGVLFDDMDVSAVELVDMTRLLQPKVEAEVAFVLSRDLVAGSLDDDQIRQSIAYAVAALEIVDSRIADWDITFNDTVADNASSGLFVLGENRVALDAFEPVEATMRMFLDGRLVSEGDGAACLGDPLNSLAWLARSAREFGDPLLAGQVILSGALGPMVPAAPGARFEAEITGLGTVSTTFSHPLSGGTRSTTRSTTSH